MTPEAILKIRAQAEALDAQAAALRAKQDYAAADAVADSATKLWLLILPLCWSCGATLSIADAGDHLCNGCIGDLPLDWPKS